MDIIGRYHFQDNNNDQGFPKHTFSFPTKWSIRLYMFYLQSDFHHEWKQIFERETNRFEIIHRDECVTEYLTN